MNQEELREYIRLHKELFGTYKFWIVDAKGICYLVKICKTTVWVENKDSHAFNVTDTLVKVEFPIRLEPSEYPPFDCIGLLWQSNRTLRVGQWFMNNFDPLHVDMKLYNETDYKTALQMIFQKYYQV